MMFKRDTILAVVLALPLGSAFGAAEFATVNPAPGTIYRWVALPGALARIRSLLSAG